MARLGDVVWIAPNEKHWHGATRVTTITHIAIQGSARRQSRGVDGEGEGTSGTRSDQNISQRGISRFISPFVAPDWGIGVEFAFNLRASSSGFSVHLYSGSIVTRP